ncbi:MAG TPA: protein kinase [Vicinamibacterales bacterium]|nr:protein kinase [Vicinamibacterales bacterium]
MTLTPGTRLGTYEIVAAIGAGGMGEVYRARDTKLNRDVALKILPETFAAVPDRLTRFTREAQTLASLNHPNIAQIHGLEDSSSVHALVMEFVDGTDLSQRIGSGPIPVDDAVAIAGQIADAIEAAHEQGIVHRDLKPANVKVRADGTVKVLDFGLAKALEGSGAPHQSASLSLSPTVASPAMTGIGMIMGTAAYMSPEQAKGKAVDKRADIWSFGVVLYEMLTGRMLFEGETASEVMAAVIMREPDLSALPANVPPSLRYVIGRCLVRDPKLRLRDIGEVRLALSGSAMVPVAPTHVERRRSGVNRWLLALATGLALALIATGLGLWRASAPAPAASVIRFDVQPPGTTSLSLVARPTVALSPDGSLLAFVASTQGESRLYLRSIGDVTARAIPGTEGASNPVFSPDGKEIAFFANGRLERTTLDGIVSMISEAGSDGDPRGIAWLPDGTLVFGSIAAGPLVQVRSTGGPTRAITTLDEKKGERTHRWPAALPGGKLLFTVGTLGSPDNYDRATIEAMDLASGKRQVVLEGASSARYASSGHLLFVRESILYAVPFDVDTLTTRGTPVQVLRGVNGDTTTGASHIAIAENGTIAYASGTALAAANRLVWVDRQGKAQPIGLPQGLYFDPRISPDGTRVAVTWQTLTAGNGDIWVSDLTRNTFTRLSFSEGALSPVWSADGRTIYYSSIDPSGRKTTIMRRPADGSRDAERVAVVDSRAYLQAVTPDEKTVLLDYQSVGGPTSGKGELVTLSLAADAKPQPLVTSVFDEYGATWSPDRRWLAYQSDESGRAEVYVRNVSSGGGRWQVSTNGGEEPHWSPDGRALYYRNETQLMSVAVDTRTTFVPAQPQLVFDGVYNLRSDTGISYAVAPTGDRFLMVRLTEENMASRLTVVTNWFAELRRLTSSTPR